MGAVLLAAEAIVLVSRLPGAFPRAGGLQRAAPQVTPLPPAYWTVAADGTVRSFGSAPSFGSTGPTLQAPIVGMAATPGGGGYWLVASDGGVFSFGDARFAGSAGGIRLNRPIVGMAATPGGGGYWLVASDGGVFSFGDARFAGSAGGIRLNRPIVGMAATPGGGGYWLVASDGGVFAFGDAVFRGAAPAPSPQAPVVAMAVGQSLDPYPPGGLGYDVSWPQCGAPLPPPPFEVAAVGVSGGWAFGHNPCLAAEASWGRQARLTLYLMLNSPSRNAPQQGANGPAGVCTPGDSSCAGFNYGYNAALDGMAYAAAQGAVASLWWLDVELPAGFTGSHWDDDLAANREVVMGALAALTEGGVQVGIYSNSYQWPLIVGDYSPLLPAWQARPNPASSASTAAAYCTAGLFTAGPVWLVQYGVETYDLDLAC